MDQTHNRSGLTDEQLDALSNLLIGGALEASSIDRALSEVTDTPFIYSHPLVIKDLQPYCQLCSYCVSVTETSILEERGMCEFCEGQICAECDELEEYCICDLFDDDFVDDDFVDEDGHDFSDDDFSDDDLYDEMGDWEGDGWEDDTF